MNSTRNRADFLGQLATKSCEGLSEPNAIKLRLLRQRGFICDADGKSVSLIESASTDLDAETFKTICSTECWKDLPEELSEADIEALARDIWRLSKTVNGMAGRQRGGDFFNTRWGARVDVLHLDPGVALLVKSLPMIGALTWQSCDGHHLSLSSRLNQKEEIGPCWIDCQDDLHAKWVFFVLVDLASKQENFQIAIRPLEQIRIPDQIGLTIEDRPFRSREGLSIDRDGSRVSIDISRPLDSDRLIIRDIRIRELAEAILTPEIFETYREIRPNTERQFGNLHYDSVPD
jgi:hypothetical protein